MGHSDFPTLSAVYLKLPSESQKCDPTENQHESMLGAIYLGSVKTLM